VPENATAAVECGALVRLISMGDADAPPVLEFLVLALRLLCDQERWKLPLVQAGLAECLLRLLARFAPGAPDGARREARSVCAGGAAMLSALAGREALHTRLLDAGVAPALAQLLGCPAHMTQTSAAHAAALLAASERGKEAAREAGQIAPLAWLVGSRHLPLRVECAKAIRQLSPNNANKRLLVTPRTRPAHPAHPFLLVRDAACPISTG